MEKRNTYIIIAGVILLAVVLTGATIQQMQYNNQKNHQKYCACPVTINTAANSSKNGTGCTCPPFGPTTPVGNQSINCSMRTNYSSYYSSANASFIATNMNNFAIKSFLYLNNQSGNQNNTFFSPFSLFTAMSMASEGTSGSTLSEIQNAFGLSTNQSIDHSGIKSILDSLNAPNAKYCLSNADAMWVEKSFSIEQNFSNTISNYYYGKANPADFINNYSGETININNWVSNETNNKI